MWTTIGARLLNLFLRNLVCVGTLKSFRFLVGGGWVNGAGGGWLGLGFVACGVGIAGAFLLVLISTSVLDYLV